MANANIKFSQLPSLALMTNNSIIPVVDSNQNFTITGNVLKEFVGGGNASTYGNANVADFLPTYTGNLVSLQGNVNTTGIVQAAYLYGDGSNISNISGGGGGNSISNGSSNVVIPTNNGNILAYIAGGIVQQLTPTTIMIGTQSSNNIIQQGFGAISIGTSAAGALNPQGAGAVALGQNAGFSEQGDGAIAIGVVAGNAIQGGSAVAIGRNAGQTNQGNNSIAIGSFAGQTNQPNNSIILNAFDSPLNQTIPNSFTVRPVRNVANNIAQALYYNTTTGEITYAPPTGGGGGAVNSIIAGTNITISSTGANGTGDVTINASGDLTVSEISNGNSIVSIPTADGNVNMVVDNTTVANFSSTTTEFFANIIAPQFIGDGELLSNITGSNVVGAVANATFATSAGSANTANASLTAESASIANIANTAIFANTANSVAGANVIGAVENALFATNADIAATAISAQNAETADIVIANSQPNITSLGILTSLISSGNIRAANIQSDNYQYANGQPFVPDAGVTQLIAGTGIILDPSSGIGQVTISSDGSSNVDVIAISSGTTNLGIPIPGGNINMVVGASSVANFAPTTAQFFANVISPQFIGNGSQLTSITGSNVVGAVANATFATNADSAVTAISANNATTADIVVANSQPNITSVGTLNSLQVTGNISTSESFIGNGSALTGLTGSQITGPVASANTAISADTATTATTAITITANSQPNITSVGTLTSLISSGNIRAANIQSDNYQYANGQPFVPDAGVTQLIAGTGIILNPASGIGQVTISSDGSSNVDVIAISSGTTNLGIPIPGGNINMVVGASSVANFAPSMAQFFANVTSPNFIGNGRALTGLIGSQITGAVDSANTAATVTTNSQPNITSVGTLANLTSTGNIVSTGGFFLGDGGRLSNISGGGSSSSISNGTSNVSIPTAGGPINMTVFGTRVARLEQQSIAIGDQSGLTNRSVYAIAIGSSSGSNGQGAYSTAIGYQTAFQQQGANAIALGFQAGYQFQGANSIAIGGSSGSFNQPANSIVINATGNTLSNPFANTLVIKPIRNNISSVAQTLFYEPVTGEITYAPSGSGTNNNIFNGNSNVSIPVSNGNIQFFVGGQDMGEISPFAVAFGLGAGGDGNSQNQLEGAVAIGYRAAGNSSPQQFGAVAIGNSAGFTSQGGGAVAIGNAAGQGIQKAFAVAIGNSAGFSNQGFDSVAIGSEAGRTNQGDFSTAIGFRAANQSQGKNATAIGYQAAFQFQADQATAIGQSAGGNYQGNNAVAIGSLAGLIKQGANSIAIGSLAGVGNTGANTSGAANNTIILNATGANLDQTIANTFTVKPIRGNATVTNLNKLYYNTVSGEIQYFTTVGSADNVMSIDTARATPGSAGQTIAISDATPANRPAYWSTSSWLYVNDNSAV